MKLRPTAVLARLGMLAAIAIAPTANAQETHDFDCGNFYTRGWLDQFRAAVARGELPDPSRPPASSDRATGASRRREPARAV